jgi:hypothetical protein
VFTVAKKSTSLPTVEDRLNAARNTVALIGELLHGLEHVAASNGDHLRSEALGHATDLCTRAHEDIAAVLGAVSHDANAPAPGGDGE